MYADDTVLYTSAYFISLQHALLDAKLILTVIKAQVIVL